MLHFEMFQTLSILRRGAALENSAAHDFDPSSDLGFCFAVWLLQPFSSIINLNMNITLFAYMYTLKPYTKCRTITKWFMILR